MCSPLSGGRYEWWFAVIDDARPEARREPQQGPGKHSSGAPNIFMGPFWGENFWIFFSQWYILSYFIFLADGGVPKRRGARIFSPDCNWKDRHFKAFYNVCTCHCAVFNEECISTWRCRCSLHSTVATRRKCMTRRWRNRSNSAPKKTSLKLPLTFCHR